MMKIISNNKKASYEYFLLEKYEAGIVLTGTEIKSIRQGKCNIEDSYINIGGNTAIIIGMNIPKFDNGNINNHEEKRPRNLLLHKKEMLKISQKVKEEGLTIIPTKLYLDDRGRAKLEIALSKGKKKYDKRESIKEREVNRKIQRGEY